MGLLKGLKGLFDSEARKGSFGEQLTGLVSKAVTDALVLHDVLIDGAEGATSQIDLLLIDDRGIYVVEVKNYPDAVIYGDGKKSQWYYYRGGKRFEIYSPLRQNRQHVQYLKKLLADMGNIPCFNAVVMLCKDFKVENISEDPDCPDTFLCSSLPAMLRGKNYLDQYHPKVLGEPDKKAIWQHIKERQHTGEEARRKHVEQVSSFQKQREELERKNYCPHCQKPLVLRHGTYGDFYGCPNYPKCRYTRKSEEKTV